MSERNDLKSDGPSRQSSLESDTDISQSRNEGTESRYAKTFQVFQQMGLLEYALQMAKLCKENEQLQAKLNKLEMKVNESTKKARKGLEEKLEQVTPTDDSAST